MIYNTRWACEVAQTRTPQCLGASSPCDLSWTVMNCKDSFRLGLDTSYAASTVSRTSWVMEGTVSDSLRQVQNATAPRFT